MFTTNFAFAQGIQPAADNSAEAQQIRNEKQALMRVLSGQRADGIVIAAVSTPAPLMLTSGERDSLAKAQAMLSPGDIAQRRLDDMVNRQKQFEAYYLPLVDRADSY